MQVHLYVDAQNFIPLLQPITYGVCYFILFDILSLRVGIHLAFHFACFDSVYAAILKEH